MKAAIEISYHRGVDRELATNVMKKYSSLFLNAIDKQLAAGRAPALSFQFASEDGSVLVYAGNRAFARSEGLRVNNDKAALYAIVMPVGCAMAKRILRGMLADPDLSVFYPDAVEN